MLGLYGTPGVVANDDVGFSQEHYLPARYLRKGFQIGTTVRRATAYVSGLGLFELHINGEKVSDDVLAPALSQYDKHVLYRTYDVTGNVRDGDNTVGVILGNGRFWGPGAFQAERGGDVRLPQTHLSARTRIRRRDHVAHIISDGSWKITTNGPLSANNEYDGEEYDATREMQGWDENGFDDSAWEAGNRSAARRGSGGADERADAGDANRARRLDVAADAGDLYLRHGAEHGRLGTPAHTRTARNACDDALAEPHPQGFLSTDNLRTAKVTDDYTLAGGGTETWEPRFTYHGFRYVQVEGLTQTPSLQTVEGALSMTTWKTPAYGAAPTTSSTRSRTTSTGAFAATTGASPRTARTDERQGWLGDRSQVQLGETYEFDVQAFYAKWLRDIADTQRPDGMLPSVAPAYWQRYPNDVTWPSTLFYVAANLRRQYGDPNMIASLYPVMDKFMSAARKGLTPDGLTDWAFYGDWCMPPESPDVIHSQEPSRQTDKTLLGTAYYSAMCRKMADFATLLGKPDDAARYGHGRRGGGGGAEEVLRSQYRAVCQWFADFQRDPAGDGDHAARSAAARFGRCAGGADSS